MNSSKSFTARCWNWILRAHRARGRGFLIGVRIAPEHVRGVAEAFTVGREVVLQDADRLITIVEPERRHLVADAPGDDGVQIVARVGVFSAAPGQAGHAPAKHDALELELFDQTLARIVEALADPPAAPLRIDADLHPIEPLALRVVPGGIAAAGDLHQGVLAERGGLIDPEAGGIADDQIIHGDDELPVRERVDLAL
jgi:hypothetical protein